jgi:hypothetical protein
MYCHHWFYIYLTSSNSKLDPKQGEVQIMPRGDRTGPLGYGARTGRGAGFCGGFHLPGFMNFGMRRGSRGGSGGGGGRGWRNWFNATGLMSPQRTSWSSPDVGASPLVNRPRTQELNILKKQASELQESLRRIEDRINELEAGSSKENS